MAPTDNRLLLEIAALQKMNVHQLREKYLEVFGEATTSRNKDYLFKRLAYRLQEKRYGGLTTRARARVAELAPIATVRRQFDKETLAELPGLKRDPRLPGPGTVLRRAHSGAVHEVQVLKDGFEYGGQVYRSLSEIARKITGTRWNGFGFFGLLEKESA